MQRLGLSALCTSVLLAACGGADPIVQAPAHKHAFGRRNRSAAHASDAGVAVDGGTDDVPKMVIVMPPALGPFVLLYPEEREAVRAHITQRIATLEASALTPWSDDKMRSLADRVTAGKLLENGPICARPPTLSDVVDAETKGGTDEDLLVATPSLDCDGKEECMIQVSIGGLEGEREADLMLSAKVATTKSDNADGWLDAADALAEVDELIGAGYGFGAGAPPPLVRASLRQSIGDFGSTFSASPALPPTSALEACHDASPTHREDLSYDTLVTVDAAGHASKCAVLQNDATRDPAEIKRETCVCAAAQKTKFPTTTDPTPRRALFNVIDSPTPKKHPHKTSIQARVNVLEGGDGHPEASTVLDIPQLSDCFWESNPKDDITFDVKLHLAPTGKVEAVDIATVPNQMRACLTRAYLATPFVCDMEGLSRVLHAGVSLSFHAPGGIDARAPNEDPTDGMAGKKPKAR
jgi:hypothetical protein